MAGIMDPRTQAKYLDTRQRLTEMSFNGNFGAESIEVVEYLLNMLMHTTSSYKELVDKESRLAADLALAQAQLFPLKKENSRLTRENHQLHVDNIRQTDQAANLFSEQTVAMKKLQDDMVELNHVVKLKEEQYKRIEAEKERIREAYEDLADPAIKSKNMRRVMKMSAPLPKSNRFGFTPTSAAVPDGPPVDPALIDSLRRQLEDSHAVLKKSEAEIKRLQTAVNSRELELARSSHVADLSPDGTTSGRTEQLFAADAANKRIIDQLNGQVDFLNEQLALREAQLVETADKIIRADELQVELNQKSIMYEKARTQNAELAAQLRAMEFKVAELAEAVDPDGSVSVDDLFEMSSQNDSRSIQDMPPMPPQFSSLDVKENLNRGSAAVKNRSSRGVSASVLSNGRPTSALSARGSGELVRTSTSSITALVKKPKAVTRDSAPARNVLAVPENSVHYRETSSKAITYGTTASTDRSQNSRNSENDVILSKLSAEKSGLLGEVSRLNETLSELQSGDALVKERMRRGEEKLASMKVELGEAKKQAETLARTLAKREEEFRVLLDDYDQSQANLKDAIGRLGNTASTSVELQSRADMTEGILTDALREKKEKEAMIDTLRAELHKLRKAQVESSTDKESAETRVRLLESELSQVRKTAEKSLTEATESRTEVVRLGLSVDALESEAQVARRKIESEKQAALSAQEQLSIKTAELLEATQKLALLEMSSAPSGAADQLRVDVKMLRSKIDELESEKRVLIQEKRSLEQSFQSFTSQSQTQLQRNASVETERAQLMVAMARKESDISSMQCETQRLEVELDQVKALLLASEKTCKSLRERAMEREAHLITRGESSEALNSEVQLMSRRLQSAQESYATARRQLDDNSDALVRTTERLGNAEREIVSLTEQLASSKRDAEKVDSHHGMLERQLEMTTKRANADRDELRRAATEKDALEGKIQELKALVASMEGTSRSHSLKSARLAAALEEGGEGMRRMETELQNLRDQVADRDRRLAQSQDALQHLDEDRDCLQLQLDTEQEQASVREQARQHLDSQMLQLRQVLERTEKKFSAVNNDLTAMQRQCAATEARLAALKEENLELRRRMSQKAAEVSGAAEDLMLMTKENQALTSELAETASERDRLRHRIAEVVQAMASLEQARRAVEIERSDLLDSYRAVLNEKRRLENDLSSMGAVKQRAGINAQHLHSQVAELQGVVNSHSDAEQRFAVERLALKKQVETLNEEIVRSQQRLEAVEADNRRMMQDSHAVRQSNVVLNERVQMVMKRAAAAADANKVLSSRLASVERERNATRALVSTERQRAEDMISVAEVARAQVASREVQLQRMQADASLASELSVESPDRVDAK